MTDDPFAPLPPASEPCGPAAIAEAPTVAPMLPAALPMPEVIQHRRHGTPSRIWRYESAEGALLFAVLRFDPADGKKQVLPFICGAEEWEYKAPPAPRPIYNLPGLAARLDAPVLVVEGEKAADAAAALFPDFVATTSQGGCNATGKADWSSLHGRRVIVWPDNDGPGRKAAAAVKRATEKAGAISVGIVAVPESWPEGWDLADPLPEGVTVEMLAAMLAEAAAPAPVEEVAPPADRDAELHRLAGLDDVAFALERRDAAKRLGISLADLMAAVKATRRELRRAEREAARQEKAGAGAPAWSESGLPPDPYGREDLFVRRSDYTHTAAEGLQLLKNRERVMYRGGLVRLIHDTQRNGLVVEPLTVHALVAELHAVARPYIMRARGDGTLEPEPVTLPERVAQIMIAMATDAGLRPLDGIASAPLLVEDGSFRVADGYDPLTRMWCEGMPRIDVPGAPTRADAAAALRRLRLLLRTFAFADAARVTPPGETVPVVDVDQPPGAQESAALVALLTAVCRPSLRLAPGVMIHAPAFSGAGTGKGLLVRVICAIAYGIHPRAMTSGGSPEELEKRLTAMLIGAEQVLFLDNVNGAALRSDTMACAITERPAYVRILGSSTSKAINPITLVVVTGNGLVLSEDLARRFITIELDAGVEDPEARDFRGDLLKEVFEHRGALLRDALTIWRWGRLAGDEIRPGRPLGSFHDWGRWCRDPLLALGCVDPAARVADVKANDPRRRQLAELFAAWWEHHRDQPVRIVDLHEGVRAVADPAGKGRQYLAAMIGKLEGTRAAGFVLNRIRTAGKWSPDLYALQRTAAEAPSVPIATMPAASPAKWGGVL
jgi:hypothetical protein